MLRSRDFLLIVIFFIGLLLRLLFFPQNTYFGFDQARDAYAVKEIINGKLKITGPPTATQIFNHGVLYYYIFTPIYYLSGGDPLYVSLFLRVLNSVGIFLIFLIALPMFGELTAILAAILFAFSYEQTQFSLFLNHPSLAVLSVLIFYLGLSSWIFKNKDKGLLLALFGLGLSIQFEFVEVQLFGIFLLNLLFFRREIPRIKFKKIVLASVALFLPMMTYFISEIKNNFLVIKQIFNLSLTSSLNNNSDVSLIANLMIRHFHDNIFSDSRSSLILVLGFIIFLIIAQIKGFFRKQLIFLSLWFFGGFLIYFFISNDAYFYNTGTSVALLILTAFLVSKIFSKSKYLAILILIIIATSNIKLIVKNNPLGPNQKINPQVGLLLMDEQKVLDYIYQSAHGEKFAVNALTMPYNVNTTWSYLFEWYGKKKYGYVPVWGGDAAEGFPGNLKVETARSKLPNKRFLIIEPLQGIPSYLKDSFIENEMKYTDIIDRKKVGTMEIWVQKSK